jgi:peptide/nickel transport system substrate-binding protein
MRAAPRVLCALVALLGAASLAARAGEAPELAARVAAGELPPLAQRLPASPRVMAMPVPGRYGGELRLLMGRAKDVRMMSVYGYTRLLGYDQDLELVPDLAEAVEVIGEREFTIRLRAGHRWSDGAPFTSEDFRYWWQDIAGNSELSPFGPPAQLLVEGEPPQVEFPDALTVRYRWSRPNPFFLTALAATHPLHIYAPAHYLKPAHARYADREALDAAARAAGQRDWAALHTNLFSPYKNLNPDLPALDPWLVSTSAPSTRFVFERNPYFHRVDAQGRQLPYIDRVLLSIADGKLIPAKTGAAESDLQARHLSFSDFTFLKAAEKRTGYAVHLWRTTKGAHLALFPNLNVTDPTWRELLRDVRFRRALSLAVDRREINQVIYYGLAVEGNNSVMRECPLYEPRFRNAWARYAPKEANALLDALGLTARDARDIRLLPDGRPLEIIVETAGEDTEQSDVLELIESTWREVGVKLFTKPLQREVFRNRIFSGATIMSIWGGLENGLPTPDMSPHELAPTSQQQLQWPKWGQHFETAGSAGEAPDMQAAEQLVSLNEQWRTARGREQRADIWRAMLEIHSQQVFSIGIVSGVPQPVVVNARLRNVPAEGIYNWEPGAHFGIYHPDTFWFESR